MAEDEEDDNNVALDESMLRNILCNINYSAKTKIEILLYSITGDKSWYVQLI